MTDFGKGVIGVLTFLLLFFALPAWFFWFQSRIGWRFPEYSRMERDLYAGVGAVWICLTIWMLWRFVLPDWWIEATPMLSSE